MPYIVQEDREFYDKDLNQLITKLHDISHYNPGTMNYVIYRILLGWWKHEPRYHTICSIMGTLSYVAQEFYRKVSGPYEDKAIQKNGDVT